MKRSAWLGAALAASVVAVGITALGDDEPVVPAVTRSAAAPRAAGAGPAASAPAWPAPAPPRAHWPALTDSARAAWSAPPPAQVAEAASAPPAPQAPRFPYALIGRWESGGAVQVLVSTPSRTWVAGRGDVIEGQWRVERVSPIDIIVTWLPLGTTQTVVFKPA